MDGCGKCWKCLEQRGCIQTIQLAPSATPSRNEDGRRKHPPRTPDPSWEKGIATDHRGMPYLKPDLTPMGVKEAAQKRSSFEAQNKLKVSTSTT